MFRTHIFAKSRIEGRRLFIERISILFGRQNLLGDHKNHI